MEQITRIGMDTSKQIFQLHGVNAAEEPVLRSVRNSRRGKPSWPAVMCDRTKQAAHMIARDPIKSPLNDLASRRPSAYAF